MRLASLIKNPLWRSLPREARYIGVGATCAVTNNIFMLLIASIGFNYALSCFFAMLPMFFIGYGLHASVTFETKRSLNAFLRYCFTTIASYPVAFAFLFVLCDLMRLPFTIAAPVATALMFVWNYLTTHWAILRSARTALRCSSTAAES